MRGVVVAAAAAAALAGCTTATVLPTSDRARLLAVIEEQGCRVPADALPAISFSESYRLNPGMERSPENDAFWARVTANDLLEDGHLVQVEGPDGGDVLVSTYGGCASAV